MSTPQAVADLIPSAYGWSKPKFAFIDHGSVFYKTSASSNAGGSSHTVCFPVNVNERTLRAEESWESLTDDVVLAIRSGKIRCGGFTSDH